MDSISLPTGQLLQLDDDRNARSQLIRQLHKVAAAHLVVLGAFELLNEPGQRFERRVRRGAIFGGGELFRGKLEA